jgi:hypothetical protein
MSNHRLDYASRKISEAFARANERREKQLVEQQEIKSTHEKLQQQLLTLADLKAQIATFQNADNSITTTKSVDTDNASANNTGNTNTLSADEEQYQTTIVQKMVALIQQRKKR